MKILWISLLATLGAVALVTALSPVEKVLGTNARIVYLHGAWVWVAMVTFLVAAAAGLAGLVLRRPGILLWCRALGHVALLMWLAFLPQSLYLMRANWNGLFFEEPRFRVPLNLAVIGLLLQVGLLFFPLIWTAAGNLLYGLAFYAAMDGLETVLHPNSPVSQSGSLDIRVFFTLMLVLLFAASLQATALWRHWISRFPSNLKKQTSS